MMGGGDIGSNGFFLLSISFSADDAEKVVGPIQKIQKGSPPQNLRPIILSRVGGGGGSSRGGPRNSSGGGG